MKIKILTLNIWEGELLERIIDFIHKENPDIALLQEVHNGSGNLDFKYKSFSVLAEKLNYPYYSFGASFIDKRSIGKIPKGNAIFSQFPLQNKRSIFFDISFGEFNSQKLDIYSKRIQFTPRSMLGANITVSNKDINLYSMHGIWGFDGKDNERRLAMSKTIVREIKDKKNVILAGDFNMDPNTKTIKNIEVYLQSVFNNELTSTFNMKHKELPGYATAAVDMVL
ncbi:MAG: endonuclease/exonuclease/phosphatase family protein [Candidatus Levybacteria bacterium]|nr:endonuclease/exonuclease/phosphatase family protein [Candidatus Levybacteria bacterium]